MSKSLSYRTELDGLRAIAVILVLFYHAQIPVFGYDIFQAGFLGVDIFFVISGYIITRIILSELETGKFTFKGFYARRIRRILPVLFTVMIVSFPFAWMFLLPREFVEYSKSILASIFFGSNFFFYSATTEYGADSSLLKPFLHTWSLSVEEQFYILFPVLLLVAQKFPQWLVKSTIVIGILLSLKAANSLSINDPNLSFYLLPTRTWEILTGVLIAICAVDKNSKQGIATFFPIIGMSLLAATLVLYEPNTIHPGFFTIIPVTGVALLIAFSHPDEIVGKTLSHPILRYIGLISYSLYLWHFPIFAFARTLNEGLSITEKLVCILLSIFLSLASYNLIEKPFRNKQKITTKVFLPALVLLLLVPVLTSVLIIQQSGVKSRVPDFFVDEQSSRQTWNLLLDENGKPCHNKAQDFCQLKNGERPTIVIIGDSHMSTIQFDLFERLQEQFNLLAMTNDGCWFARGFALANLAGELSSKGCSLALQERRFEQLKQLDNAIVVIGGRLPLYLTNQYFDNQEGGIESGVWARQLLDISGQKSFSEGVQNTIYDILALNHQVVLVYPFVEAGWHVPKKLFANMKKSFFGDTEKVSLNTASTDFSVYQERAKSSKTILDGIEHPNAHRIYPHTLFCNQDLSGRCITHNGEYLLYTDDDHLSQRGAKWVNDLIVSKIKTISVETAQ